MLSTFYSAFSPVAFTVLGLWLVVVQTRHSDWSGSAEHRRRAYAVSLHFALPGLMSLLSLVDPNSKAMWKVSFTVIAVLGIDIAPLRVEAIALSLMLFLGINVAWLLMFDTPDRPVRGGP